MCVSVMIALDLQLTHLGQLSDTSLCLSAVCRPRLARRWTADITRWPVQFWMTGCQAEIFCSAAIVHLIVEIFSYRASNVILFV